MLSWEAESHVSFQPETGALSIRAVGFGDSGEYRCIVNGEKKRDGIVKLLVQGMKKDYSFHDKLLFDTSYFSSGHLITFCIPSETSKTL